MSTFGPAYDKEKDEPALTDQRNKIKELMLAKGEWWFSLGALSDLTGYPESSISAQLRHLRKKQFGGYQVDKRRWEGQRVWEYRLQPPADKEQMLLIPHQQKRGGAYGA